MASGSDWSGQAWANQFGSPSFAERSAQIPVVAMSRRRGFNRKDLRQLDPSERWSRLCARACDDPDEEIYFGCHAESDAESSSDDEVSSSPSPPWVLNTACEWASFAHRLLLRQQLRLKHNVVCKTRDADHKDYKLKVLGNKLQGIAQGRHVLSTVDKLEFYLGTPLYCAQ
jgi:hypothetical protein